MNKNISQECIHNAAAGAHLPLTIVCVTVFVIGLLVATFGTMTISAAKNSSEGLSGFVNILCGIAFIIVAALLGSF